MIVHIALEIDAGNGTTELANWDVPGVVAKAIAMKLNGGLELVDSVTKQPLQATVVEVCGLYDQPEQWPE
ncbi:hypothetical protein ACX3YC_12565 [Pseudomonas mohnii]|jgi:hypothetical protein|uniref:hypothetical protein n=1 Tax=Pseudomonas sp. MIL9 TaxID=2807620 RepID=UPI00102901B0|nr:hypothetical protein [Pseudomonas sp. MIL9]MBM6444850.1 hypothetical protein [Pseudomonas sp. MIL9]RZO11300.1 hypothetical protein EKG40_00320 [Pseudomonas moorei]